MKSLAERFWEKVDKNGPVIRQDLGPCWVWTASLRDTGYGQIMIAATKIPEKAHRVSWFLAHGEWPSAHVLHRCDNRPCVRPDHLFVGTNSENVADKIAKGRQPRGSAVAGVKLTLDNVLTIRRLADELTQRELAGLFSVNQALVSRIISGNRWPHLGRNEDSSSVRGLA